MTEGKSGCPDGARASEQIVVSGGFGETPSVSWRFERDDVDRADETFGTDDGDI